MLYSIALEIHWFVTTKKKQKNTIYVKNIKKTVITINGERVTPNGTTTAGGIADIKKSAQKFDFALLDELESTLKKYKVSIVQLEEELNVKNISDQE